MNSNPASPKKEKHIEGAAWAYPEHHQELSPVSPGRPKEYLGGGYGDSQREMADHYAMSRPAPIKMEGRSSIKNNPFLRQNIIEPEDAATTDSAK
jgi:hypothetical protein